MTRSRGELLGRVEGATVVHPAGTLDAVTYAHLRDTPAQVRRRAAVGVAGAARRPDPSLGARADGVRVGGDPDRRVELLGTLLSVAVADDGPRPPVLRERVEGGVAPDGLLAVAELATAWGCMPPRDGGEIVWATLRQLAPLVVRRYHGRSVRSCGCVAS
ncbi:hypothetical protein [Actinocrispum sp. NPDC049592]|uniref:hypothetical protein n=1 Tax=Actinocrispum sp. NPDC049592 TaxID=3154835 RepID=UPI00343C4BB0